jgi:DNA-binding LacI/PurR family transcriptional regulator
VSDRKPNKVRLKDLAESLGVSTSTVSRALAGQPGVREDLRRQMVAAALQAGYQVPEDLRDRRILVAASGPAMTDYVRNQFTFLVLDGMRARAEALGLRLVFHPLETVEGLAAALDGHAPAGVLLLSVDDPDAFALVHSRGVPAVIVNGDDPWMRLSSLAPSNRSSARLATDHLIAHGHRDMLFVQRPGRTTILRRLEGWRDALSARGLPCGDDRVLDVGDWLPEEAETALLAHLDRGGPPFTAVLCAADSLAAGVLKALAARGIPVPDAVSVMGMDDLPVVEFWQPPLTTMHLPSREMGGMALDMLREQLRGVREPARRVELACRLVERRSVGRTGQGRD